MPPTRADWPLRDLAPARALLEQTPEHIPDFEIAKGFDPSKVTDQDREHLDDWSTRVVHKGLYGQGLVRITETNELDGEASALSKLFASFFTGFEPNAYFITSLDINDPGLAERNRVQIAERQSLQRNAFVAASGGHSGGLRSAEVDTEVLLEEGIGLRLPPAPGSVPFRGVLIRMAALAGNEYERKVVEEFERRHWAVVHIDTRTSGRPYPTRAALDEALKVDEELAALRKAIAADYTTPPEASDDAFLRSVRASSADPRNQRAYDLLSRASRLRSGIFEWPGEQTEADLARAIAARFDETLAENAYAAEAALAYLAANRPDVPQHPLVVVGFSAGAIAAPTVVARLNQRDLPRPQVDATVLIGGGANALDIVLRSELVRRSVPVVRDGQEIPRERLLVLRDPYLEASRLDPYHTAPLLRGQTVLQAHGTSDTWVPASSGELLYELLDRPDQLVMSGGHELLFYFLPDKAEFIADWVEEATGE